MLFQNDPFRDFDALFSRVGGRSGLATTAMPMDAYRRGHDVWVHVDVAGISPENLDVSVERGVLTISAEREWQPQEDDQVYLAERARGSFRRQVHLGENLDADNVEADLHDGVLTLRIPVAEVARPRKITVGSGQKAIETSAS